MWTACGSISMPTVWLFFPWKGFPKLWGEGTNSVRDVSAVFTPWELPGDKYGRMPVEYREAGVDREQGYEIVDRIRNATLSTQEGHRGKGLNEVGGFGALYRLGEYK